VVPFVPSNDGLGHPETIGFVRRQSRFAPNCGLTKHDASTALSCQNVTHVSSAAALNARRTRSTLSPIAPRRRRRSDGVPPKKFKMFRIPLGRVASDYWQVPAVDIDFDQHHGCRAGVPQATETQEFLRCWACAANGQAVAAPPMSVMNSRRRMSCPQTRPTI
jgi:hypothetical protein